MANRSHRESAAAARMAAAETTLANVRDRETRSADAHDAMAEREETGAARLKARRAEMAACKASGSYDEDDDDGGPIT